MVHHPGPTSDLAPAGVIATVKARRLLRSPRCVRGSCSLLCSSSLPPARSRSTRARLPRWSRCCCSFLSLSRAASLARAGRGSAWTSTSGARRRRCRARLPCARLHRRLPARELARSWPGLRSAGRRRRLGRQAAARRPLPLRAAHLISGTRSPASFPARSLALLAPFVAVLGHSGYANVLALGLLAGLLVFTGRTLASALVLRLVVVLSPGVLREYVTGGDLIANTVYVAAAAVAVYALGDPALGGRDRRGPRSGHAQLGAGNFAFVLIPLAFCAGPSGYPASRSSSLDHGHGGGDTRRDRGRSTGGPHLGRKSPTISMYSAGTGSSRDHRGRCGGRHRARPTHPRLDLPDAFPRKQQSCKRFSRSRLS